MKKLSPVSFLPFVLVLGLFATACNNSTSNTNTTTTRTDTATAKTDTNKTAVAPEGKVVKGPDVEIHTIGNTMKYDVSEIHVPADTKIKITLFNDGTDIAMMHNIVILKAEDADSVAMQGFRAGQKKDYLPADMSKVIAHSALTKPGAKTVLSFKTPAKGEYIFMCTYPGHYKTMQGKFIVE
jgi:azurin